MQRCRIESNSALLFIEECCEVGPDAFVFRSSLFDRYRDYCQRNCLRPMSQTNFNEDIERTYPQIKRGIDKIAKQRTWEGLRLAEEWD